MQAANLCLGSTALHLPTLGPPGPSPCCWQRCRHGSGLTGPHLGWQVCILRWKREEEGALTHQGLALTALG